MRAGGRTRYRLVGVASLAAGWIAVVTQGGRLRRERTRGHTTTTHARRAGEELERRARRAHVGTHSSLVTPTPCPQRIPIHTPSREERLHAAPRTTEGDRRTQRRLRRVRLLELRACGTERGVCGVLRLTPVTRGKWAGRGHRGCGGAGWRCRRGRPAGR